MTFRTLVNSIGRCMFFSPPVIHAELHRLFVLFNNSYLDRRNLSTFEMKIFLIDRASSPHLYQLTKWRWWETQFWLARKIFCTHIKQESPNLIMGDPILVCQKDFLYTYQTRLSISEHVEGDPHFECAIYTKSNSFDKSIQKELKELFTKEL